MSRSQDLLALIKGIQIVANATIKTQERYLKYLWLNSSVRDIIQENYKTSGVKFNNFSKNPSKELDNIANILKESYERTSVVAEGIRQFANKSINVASHTTEKPKVTAELANLDIASITLKELENLLSQRNKDRKVSLQYEVSDLDPPISAISEKDKTKSTEDPSIYSESHKFDKDEKYVKNWMNFIASHEVKEINSEVSELKKPQDVQNINPPDNIARIDLPQLSAVAKQRRVPSSRIGRMASFGGLFAGVGLGTVNELAKGVLGLGGTRDIKEAVFSPANAERIVDTLCKVRGAALKLGQILSIQDSNVVSPQLAKAFDRVRQAADYMPDDQVEKVIVHELGHDWRSKFKEYDDKPFAAASIGQVHRGTLHDGMEVAVKIQYPGIGKSINSDIDNLVAMLKVWDVFPPGIFIDSIVKVAKRELIWEVDYIREATYTEKFGEMIEKHKEFRVPKVINELSTKCILTTELLPGIPLDQCFNLDYSHRHFVGKAIMKLCLLELFELQCMQTDPNWSNFLYDPRDRRLMLIDFGSTRFYTTEFINNYLKVILSAIDNKPDEVLSLSRNMGFLTGYETKQMEEAHVNAVMILGELFSCNGEFNFGEQNTTKRIANLVPTMIAHRLCPPPEEIYSLHRKLSGVFLLCTRLKIKLDCRSIFEEIIKTNNINLNVKSQ